MENSHSAIANNFQSQEEFDAAADKNPEARLCLLSRKLLCSDVRPRDFGPLVTDMPIPKHPVPRDTPGVEILSGPDAFMLLNERRDAAMDAGHACYIWHDGMRGPRVAGGRGQCGEFEDAPREANERGSPCLHLGVAQR